MRIVQDPSQFDVLLCENLYGDVVSDLCAGLVGGLGVTPGANIGEERAVFEAVHGSAPTLAGLNQANPLALLMSGVMLLNYISDQRGVPELRECGSRIRAAYNATLESGARTRDLGGKLGESFRGRAEHDFLYLLLNSRYSTRGIGPTIVPASAPHRSSHPLPMRDRAKRQEILRC